MLNWILFLSASIFSLIGIIHTLFINKAAPIAVVVNLFAAAILAHYAIIMWERL